MNRKSFQVIASLSFVLILTLDARAQGGQRSYPNMAPVDQYLMTDRNAEIALARSAGPESISRDAKIMVLGRHGYESAVDGKNGFVCVVERAWMSLSTRHNSGTPSSEEPSALIRRPQGPSCRLLS
jgi:hypothetical protein